MAIGTVGRPRSAPPRDSEVVAVQVPRQFKLLLEQEARAAGSKSLSDFLRARHGWPDVSRKMGPKPKEAQKA